MATPLADLVRPRPAKELKATLLELLRGEDFPVDDWNEGGIERTLVEIDTTALADADVVVSQIAKGGFLDLCDGAWLTLLAESRYSLVRRPAQVAVRKITLTDSGNAGPHNITPGGLWVSTPGGLMYTNVEGGTLPLGGSLNLQVRAESPGAKFNALIGTVTNLVTSLPGVTCVDHGNVSAGTDEESDPALRRRCRDQWAELGTGGPPGAYRNWALKADPTVTRVEAFPHPDPVAFPGLVIVVIADDSGAVHFEVVASVQAYIETRISRPVMAQVRSATAVVIPIAGTVYVAAPYLASAQASFAESLAELTKSTPIGGARIGPSAMGVAQAAIVDVVMSQAGVQNVTLTGPATDVVFGTEDVPAFTHAGLAWVAI